MIPVARAEYTCSCGTDPRDCKSFGFKVPQDLVVLVLLAAPSFEQSFVSPVELSRLPCYVFFFLYVGNWAINYLVN